MGQKIQGSRVLNELRQSTATGHVLEGGSRSTKTYSIIQDILLYCQINKDKRITISRDRLTWLKDTVLKDFQDILKQMGWWNENHYNKSECVYHLFGNEISFIGLDEEAKIHGRKQDIFWINELIGTAGSAYNCSIDIFDQLEMRTTEKWYVDYNPKTTNHWVYSKLIPRPDVKFIHSTMLDNPFLEEKIRRKILSYEPTTANIILGSADSVKWNIYGLGKRAHHEGIIFTNVKWIKDFPKDCQLIGNGLDFGFSNDVTAMMRVGKQGNDLFIDQLIYTSGLLNTDISRLMESEGVGRQIVRADSAEQKSIAELKSKGWSIKAVKKGAGSISAGIDYLKTLRINITERSTGMKEEQENYVWKQDYQTGKYLNVPVDAYNHGWDAIRYACEDEISHTTIKRPNFLFAE